MSTYWLDQLQASSGVMCFTTRVGFSFWNATSPTYRLKLSSFWQLSCVSYANIFLKFLEFTVRHVGYRFHEVSRQGDLFGIMIQYFASLIAGWIIYILRS